MEVLVESFCIEKELKKVCIEISKGDFKEFLEEEFDYLKEEEERKIKLKEEDWKKFKKDLLEFLNFEEDKDECSGEEVWYYERSKEDYIIIDNKEIIINGELEFYY